jgi:L-lactate dehydrogenase (cytochrome)
VPSSWLTVCPMLHLLTSLTHWAVLKDELKSNMRTLGIVNVDQARPELVNTLDIDHMVPSTEGHPYIQWKPRVKL